ncbi:hypothetical protein HF325_005379 [Metschnikowia pulcherrima]|uniref:EXPERA domain-containing protein n=1 Tax=Metschnikowia pulcherrima TaxID=27326 RepID=A0A8H7LAH8_9ASCO|nr:hypothetical protein HF325_005379 [Metschnikowia pulcherrima]
MNKRDKFYFWYFVFHIPITTRRSGSKFSARSSFFFQLPVFFLAAYKLYQGRRNIHVILALYGFNASFTTAVCLAYVIKSAHLHGLTNTEKWNLFALYVPYLVIPAFMMVDSALRLSNWVDEAQRKDQAKIEKNEKKALKGKSSARKVKKSL